MKYVVPGLAFNRNRNHHLEPVMKYLIAVITLSLAACGTTSIYDPVFTPEYDKGAVKVTQIEVTERAEMTAKCQGGNVIKDKLGCAMLADNSCAVVSYKGFAGEYAEHGAKHCRYGKWHD